eukprot:CAMPEP_0174756538 /NCGR_PEP_ID=MMETSP1094-20130205/106805_1 /TAXON_ID=156173 /ORGANISM="Chrysochromulina brevifilum, Strain UTEX LB 985" /LENGTH=118 /DNA_ID=CAMNT_0015962443 /DNA_START=571 /DNA_END=927 /DNA_ORIENTATION=-
MPLRGGAVAMNGSRKSGSDGDASAQKGAIPLQAHQVSWGGVSSSTPGKGCSPSSLSLWWVASGVANEEALLLPAQDPNDCMAIRMRGILAGMTRNLGGIDQDVGKARKAKTKEVQLRA